MNEAIDELKENEFKDLYEEEQNIDTKEYVKDIVIESDFEILFPDEYINNVSERLALYNELATLKTEDELLAFQNKRSEEHTSELQSRPHLVCRLLLEK